LIIIVAMNDACVAVDVPGWDRDDQIGYAASMKVNGP
jgi:hypothetical protein